MKIRQLKQQDGTVVLQIGEDYRTGVKNENGYYIEAVRWHDVPVVHEEDDVDFESLEGEISMAAHADRGRREAMKKAAAEIEGLDLSG